jgi:hypothetical protein
MPGVVEPACRIGEAQINGQQIITRLWLPAIFAPVSQQVVALEQDKRPFHGSQH